MIIFQNPGVIDPRSITTFGTSSKDNPSTAIGYFGTGLKYAIAVLLREHCSVSIYSDGKPYHFSTVRQKIRNDEFDLVYMNSEPLGFTTELGKNWKPWMAYRELLCNARDEGGGVETCDPGKVIRSDGCTIVAVEGAMIEQAHSDRSLHFLSEDRKPIWVGRGVNIYAGESDALYYRGVRVFDLPKKSLYTYELTTKTSLTEDRTLSHVYVATWNIRDCVQQCELPSVVSRVLTADDLHYEQEFQFNGGSVSSPTFLAETRRLMREFNPMLNRTAARLIQQTGLDAMEGAESFRLDEIDQARLDQAIAFCKEIGFDVTKYPIQVSVFLGEGTLGCAHKDKIYLSERVFQMGTKMVAGTLIEEYLHLSTKCEDCTRNMQNILIDRICSLGERITRRPL